MKTYYAYLAGIHPTIPFSELASLLSSLGVRFQIVLLLDQVAVFRADRLPRGVAKYSGTIHEVGTVAAIVDAELEKIVETAPSLCSLLSGSFRVDAVRVKGYRAELDTREIARKLGAAVANECRAQVDLENPATIVRVIVSEGVAVVGTVVETIDKKSMAERRPEKRPFFRSVALEPRLARIFVNLARPKPGGVYLDPFCGTGGFILEAAWAARTAVCSDIDRSMVEGARENIKYYGVDVVAEIVQADAAALPLRSNSVDFIGTDPPYGRQAPLKGHGLKELLKGFAREALRVVKSGSCVCYAQPHWLQVEPILSGGLRPIEQHFMRVHGSLTRVLVVACKNRSMDERA